jgi:multidrug resistance efflux pump
MKNSRFSILIIAILVVVAIGLAIFGPIFLKKKVVKLPTEVQEIKNKFITAKGIVESEEEIELSSQVTGIITKISVDEGDPVKRGQPLVMLDKRKILAKMKQTEAMLRESKAHLRELEAGYRVEDIEMAKSRVKRAEAIYEKAKDEYERQRRLYEKDATTLMELEKAKERMKVAFEDLNESRSNLQKLLKGIREEEIERAKATVEGASSDLKYYNALREDYTLSSPIDGLVAERLKDANETVDTDTPILKLINPEKLRIRAELEETDVGKVIEGQIVEVYTDAYKDRVYHGKAYKVFPVVKRRSQRTFDPMASFDINTQEIYIRLDDFSGLKNGMSVTVGFLK